MLRYIIPGFHSVSGAVLSAFLPLLWLHAVHWLSGLCLDFLDFGADLMRAGLGWVFGWVFGA